jgi:hypothetical protein
MRTLPMIALCLVLGACATSHLLPPEQSTGAVLARSPSSPDELGKQIYEGVVYPLHGARTAPRFIYERRVQVLPDGLRSTSFTRDGTTPAVVEIAEHGTDYSLRRFVEYQHQLGQVGRVELTGGIATFTLVEGSTERTCSETVTDPVVVGPTLYGFIRQHWSPLMAGERLPIRFAVPSRLETIGFELERTAADAGEVTIRMRPTSPLIALVVAPLVITWTEAGALLALDGRVPTRLPVDGQWRDFDAHTEYPGRPSTFD